jgi:hypothetical protein
MRILVCFAIVLCACTNSKPLKPICLDQVIEYSIDHDQQAVIVVMDGISLREAKKLAQQRAAELTISQGGRYFTIDQEEETRMIQSKDLPGSQKAPGNLYEELIIQKDFGRSRVDRGGQMSKAYPAFRLIFTPYREKPNGSAIDACRLTNCHSLQD